MVSSKNINQVYPITLVRDSSGGGIVSLMQVTDIGVLYSKHSRQNHTDIQLQITLLSTPQNDGRLISLFSH